MHILVTNDDGVFAPGLLALAQAMQPLGTVSILAPEHNWSVAGHGKTLHRPLRVNKVSLSDGTEALACDGYPSDCVALAALGLLPEPVDLVVSGINPAPNLGADITYSGTIANALEATIWKIPGIAFSLDVVKYKAEEVDFSPAAAVAQRVAIAVLEHGLPPDVLLNVNIPYLPLEKLTSWRITRQGQRIYRDTLVSRQDPFGKPYYWIGGDPPAGEAAEGTDIGAIRQGCISITPLHLDMTAQHVIDELSNWQWR